jgi:hypothetical protein
VTFDTIGQVSLGNEAWTNASLDVDGNYVLLLILHCGKPRGSIVKERLINSFGFAEMAV